MSGNEEAEAAVLRGLAALSESFIAASGPGGQNVNKVATAVQLRLDAYALRLAPMVFARFKLLAGTRLTPRANWSSPRGAFARKKPTAATRGHGWPN